MYILNHAHTCPINPPNASITLTRAQVWAGLQRKIRFAQEFVPMIESCTVVEEKDGVVERVVKFKPGQGHRDVGKEWVRVWEDAWVDFEQDDGTHIRNVISDGSSGDPSDIYMTYMFEFHQTHVQPGTPEAKKEHAKLVALAKKAVESSIETIREMVKDGRIAK